MSEEFHYIFLGEEPAGLWLASRLHELHATVGLPARIGVIGFGHPVSVFFPKSLAHGFGIEPGPVWSPEIVSPERTFRWEKEKLLSTFPVLQESAFDPAADLGAASSAPLQLDLVRAALRRHPDLLSLASGIWKFLGRARCLQAESLVRSALLCTELFEWTAVDELPDTVERISVDLWETRLESARAMGSRRIEIKFENRDPIRAQKCFLNLSFRALERISGSRRHLWDAILCDRSLRSPETLYSLGATLDAKGIPGNVRPLTVWLDSEEIPDFTTEIWPLRVSSPPEGGRKVELWASGPNEPSVDAVLDQFRQGVKRLNRLFPYFSRSLQGLTVPLSVETCHGEELRNAVEETIDATAVETYRLTSFQTTTRWKSLEGLFPFLSCHLPYPVGPLIAARHWLRELDRKLRKKTKKPLAEVTANP